MVTAADLGIAPQKLRQRPYLHLDATAWERLRVQLTSAPHEGLQRCRHDSRPGPNRPPRFQTAILEAAAFVAAVSDSHADRSFLRTHLDLVLATRGMDMIGVLRGHFLAALAFAHDLLGDVLDEPELAALRRTLTDHARRAHEAVQVGFQNDWPRESPKAVATLAGLHLAGLALLPDEPEAAVWVTDTDVHLEAMLRSVATDGWWPTGFEDWNLLLPLLVRVADAWEHLAERDRFDYGLFRQAWAVAIHGLAPGEDDLLDVDLVGRSDLGRRQAVEAGRPGEHYRWRQEPGTWALARLAQRFTHPGFRLAVARWQRRGLGRGSPWAVLWEPRGRVPAVPQPDRPYHVFEAHGLAVWRSGWSDRALAVAVATGPAYGAAEPAWQPATPLDADANHFLVWHDGQPLVADPGRVGPPVTRLHNTLLIDGADQLPTLRQEPGAARLEAHWLSDLGGCLVGSADGAYPPELGVEQFHRHLAVTPDYLVVFDQVAAARRCRYEWLLQTAGEIDLSGRETARLTSGGTALSVHLLRPSRVRIETRPATGHVGQPLGTTLSVVTAEAVFRTQFLVLLTPERPGARHQAGLITGDTAVGARLQWQGGEVEEVLFPTRSQGIVLDHLISDGAWLALRRRAGEGDWRRLVARRVARVLVYGGEILSAGQPVDVALQADGESVSGEVHSPTGTTFSLRCPFTPRGVMVDGQSGRARIDRTTWTVSIRLTAGRHHLRIAR